MHTLITEPALAQDTDKLAQLLTPDGERVHDARLDRWAEEIDVAELRDLYRRMTIARRADVEGVALQRQGQLGLWAPCNGQEAAQIGMGRASRPQDFVFPTYREHGVALVRGLDPARLLGLFRGVDHGGWDPAELRTHPYMIVLGSQAPHAVGAEKLPAHASAPFIACHRASPCLVPATSWTRWIWMPCWAAASVTARLPGSRCAAVSVPPSVPTKRLREAPSSTGTPRP